MMIMSATSGGRSLITVRLQRTTSVDSYGSSDVASTFVSVLSLTLRVKCCAPDASFEPDDVNQGKRPWEKLDVANPSISHDITLGVRSLVGCNTNV